MKVNQYLTPAAHKMLLALRDGEDHYVAAEGREVWVDDCKFSRRTLNVLIRLCLISLDSLSREKPEIWEINSEGREIIDDPAYVPMIIAHLTK